MTPQDRQSFIEIVLGFAELKGKQLSAPALELYWRSMQHWPLEEFQIAAQHLLRTCEFMPVPKDFEDLRKASRPTPSEAWIKAVASSGQTYTPQGFFGSATSGDPLIDKAVRALGGYGVIAGCDTDKLHWFEKRFTEIYENMQDAEDVRESVPMIAGPSQVPKLSGPRRAIDALPQLKRPA